MKPFHASGNTIKMAASTASTNMAITSNGAAPQVMVSNTSTAWANVVFGSSTVTSTMATTAASGPGYMVGPGVTDILTPGTAATYMAAELVSGTGSIFATPGEGY